MYFQSKTIFKILFQSCFLSTYFYLCSLIENNTIEIAVDAKVYDYLYLLIERTYMKCNIFCEKRPCEVYLVCLVHAAYCFYMHTIHAAHFLAMRYTLECLIDVPPLINFSVFFHIGRSYSNPPPAPPPPLLHPCLLIIGESFQSRNLDGFLKQYTYADFFAISQK